MKKKILFMLLIWILGLFSACGAEIQLDNSDNPAYRQEGTEDAVTQNEVAVPSISDLEDVQLNVPTVKPNQTPTPIPMSSSEQTLIEYEFTDMQSILTMFELAEEECLKKVEEEYELFFDETDDYTKYINKPETVEIFHSNVIALVREMTSKMSSIYWSGCKFVAAQYVADENYDYYDAFVKITSWIIDSIQDFYTGCQEVYVDAYYTYENAIDISHELKGLDDKKIDELIDQYEQIEELLFSIEDEFEDTWAFIDIIYSEFEKGNTDIDSIYDLILVNPTPIPITYIDPTPTPIEIEGPTNTPIPTVAGNGGYSQQRAPNDAGYPAYISIRLKRQESTGINVHEILFYNIETGVEYYVEFNPFNFKHETLWFEYINLPLGTYEINGGVFQDYIAKYTLYTEENPLTLQEGVQEISCIIGDREWVKENMDWKWDVDEYRATLPTPTPIPVGN